MRAPELETARLPERCPPWSFRLPFFFLVNRVFFIHRRQILTGSYPFPARFFPDPSLLKDLVDLSCLRPEPFPLLDPFLLIVFFVPPANPHPFLVLRLSAARSDVCRRAGVATLRGRLAFPLVFHRLVPPPLSLPIGERGSNADFPTAVVRTPLNERYFFCGCLFFLSLFFCCFCALVSFAASQLSRVIFGPG